MRVALGCGFGVALGCLSPGYQQALRWLWVAFFILLLHSPLLLPSNSITQATNVVTPLLMDGSGTGAQSGEWSEGSGLPVCLLAWKASALTPPMVIIQIGTLGSVRPNSEKSSPPIEGFFCTRFVAPNQPLSALTSLSVSFGSLYREGVN